MSTTALLPQNDNTAIDALKNNVGYSMLNLSHTVTYPIDVEGAITPICCVETVPSDRFEISNEILLRQLQPLKVPLMTRFTLNTAYFYCSNRLAWKKWSMFADQANKGRDLNYTFELPRVANSSYTVDNKTYYDLIDINTSQPAEGLIGSAQNYKNTLHTYFNVSLNSKFDGSNFKDNAEECPLAFPQFDYQMICRDFYTNIDRIPDNPDINEWYNFDNPFSDWSFSNLYPIDDDEIKLIDGIQIMSGFHTGDDSGQQVKGFVLDKVRYHDCRDDYFTATKRSPQRGDAPTVDTTIAVTSIDASDAVYVPDADGAATLGESLALTNDNRFVAGKSETNLNSESQNYGMVNMTTVHKDASAALKANLEKLKVNLSVAKSINVAELRLMSQLQIWQELNMMHKPCYNDFLNAHFNNIRVGDSLAEAPQFIGGTSQVININEVLQTSATTSGGSPLGTQGAVAHSLSGSNVGTYYCQDYGFIIGVAYIIPDLTYKPAIPRWASRRAIEDYYFTEFANLSMQATLNKELFFSSDPEWNNQPLGYTGAYDEMRTQFNYCAGDMLNSSYTDLQHWVISREFSNDNKPAINQRFLSLKGNVNRNAWSAPYEPKFMMQVANYIKALRPMPYIAIPKAL